MGPTLSKKKIILHKSRKGRHIKKPPGTATAAATPEIYSQAPRRGRLFVER